MIAVIDYNAGNIRSVLYALERLGYQGVLTSDHKTIRNASRVIFPGVGEANTTMRVLKERGLDEVIRSLSQPVLGICLGMQLLCDHSEEGDTACLGIIPHIVKRFVPFEQATKVPHMGWNTLYRCHHDQFPAEAEAGYVYFVHSYYVTVGSYTTALCDYIHPFSAALRKENFYATQFHPEKSGDLGSSILAWWCANVAS